MFLSKTVCVFLGVFLVVATALPVSELSDVDTEDALGDEVDVSDVDALQVSAQTESQASAKAEWGGSRRRRRRRRWFPHVHIPIINCHVSGWYGWGHCNRGCGGGRRTRTRRVMTWPVLGRACPALSESGSCNTHCCPVHGAVHGWGGWSGCSASCGYGRSTRSRGVRTHPRCGGHGLPGLSESRTCINRHCPVHCAVHGWAGWSGCSRSCAGGTSTRVRGVRVNPAHGGNACPGLRESRSCNTHACPRPCIQTPWSAYTACSRPCNGGTKSRTRRTTQTPISMPACGPTSQVVACNTHRCTPSPTRSPTEFPTPAPSHAPTEFPTRVPTPNPSEVPTPSPTSSPTEVPTTLPPTTEEPSYAPTHTPTEFPSPSPTAVPTEVPSPSPTLAPTDFPSEEPTESPTEVPTPSPTDEPTDEPTEAPTEEPTEAPTPVPSAEPTEEPTEFPTDVPSYEPSFEPTVDPTYDPTEEPTTLPPTATPTDDPIQVALVGAQATKKYEMAKSFMPEVVQIAGNISATQSADLSAPAEAATKVCESALLLCDKSELAPCEAAMTACQKSVEDVLNIKGDLMKKLALKKLNEGYHVEVGQFHPDVNKGIDHKETTASFRHTFAATPVVIAGVVSFLGGHPVVPEVTAVTTSSATIKLAEPSCYDTWHKCESMDWLAVSAGPHKTDQGVIFEVGETVLKGGDWNKVTFQHTFASSPAVVPTVQGEIAQWANLRLKNVNVNGFEILLESAKKGTTYPSTASVKISYIAIPEGDGTIAGQDYAAKVTAAEITEKWSEYSFPKMTRPRVFAGVTHNGGHTGNLRLKDQKDGSIKLRVDEPQKCGFDEIHPFAESAHLLVIQDSHVPPTATPTEVPTAEPTLTPTEVPTTMDPTTDAPSRDPTATPTEAPSSHPTTTPTELPTVVSDGLSDTQSAAIDAGEAADSISILESEGATGTKTAADCETEYQACAFSYPWNFAACGQAKRLCNLAVSQAP